MSIAERFFVVSLLYSSLLTIIGDECPPSDYSEYTMVGGNVDFGTEDLQIGFSIHT